MSPEILGLVGLASLFGLICIGFPISFTLIFLALALGYIGFGQVVFYLMTLQFFGVMTDTVLSAVPFFLFMGYILEDSGLMNRLFKAFQLMLAKLSGSLYIAVTSTATIFSAATGIVGSSITLLGVMAAPTMKESKYDTRLSAGGITAGGTLSILIPPSIMLVVMGPVVSVPVTELFAAAILPGLMLAGLYMTYALVRSYFNPKLGPPLAEHLRAPSRAYIVRELFFGVLPVSALILALIFVLGWPLEWVPIVLIILPVLLPIINHMGYDMLWFSILVAVTLQTACLSPPVTLSAYFLKSVVPDWNLKDIYAGMMQFMALQCVGVLLILFFPGIVTWLPSVLR